VPISSLTHYPPHICVVLKLALDQEDFARYDFGRQINLKLYTEPDSFLFSNTAFDASTFTGAVIKVFKRHGDRAFFFRDIARSLTVLGSIAQIINDITIVWDTQASGIGHFSFDSAARPSIPGNMWIMAQLTKSGEQTSSELKKVFIQPSEGA